jgi:uncharacterized repeat protein (TIGR03803 family)
VILDSTGNIYGTTEDGGSAGGGIAFKVAPDGTETVLHTFQGDGNGYYPADSLVMDAQGNLYGTTAAGGGSTNCNDIGCGTIFEISASGTESILYAFQGGSDGADPEGNLVSDAEGNFYGTTALGGGSPNCGDMGCGTIFEFTAQGTENILYLFDTNGNDGSTPLCGLIRDASGNFYGTTGVGGAMDHGTVFRLASDGTETVLHSFMGGSDGIGPTAPVVMDTDGNLFGTTRDGSGIGCRGSEGCGVVFEVTAKGRGKVLYPFRGSHGRTPLAGLLLGAHGELYGTASAGGKDNNGVIFKLEK